MPILRATSQHLETLVPLFDGYRCFYGHASDPERARRFLRERLEREDSVVLLALPDGAPDGAEEGASAAGFTQLFPLFTSVGTQRIWLLNDLYVAQQARRQGVAKALMQASADFAREDGAKTLELATQKENASAKALYEALGYRLDREFDHYALTL